MSRPRLEPSWRDLPYVLLLAAGVLLQGAIELVTDFLDALRSRRGGGTGA